MVGGETGQKWKASLWVKDRKKKKRRGGGGNGMKTQGENWRGIFYSWLPGPDCVWNLLWTPSGVQSPVKWSNKEINGKVEGEKLREWEKDRESFFVWNVWLKNSASKTNILSFLYLVIYLLIFIHLFTFYLNSKRKDKIQQKNDKYTSQR